MPSFPLASAGAAILGSIAVYNTATYGNLSGVTELTRNALSAGIMQFAPIARVFHNKKHHLKYPHCDEDQVQNILDTISAAQIYAEKAAALMDSLSTGAGDYHAYYQEWFGEWEQERWFMVRERFDWMNKTKFSSFKYDCECPEEEDGSSYGLTYPDETGIIYLCNNFWSAPLSGTNSRAGTLVHEATHWTAVANGTTDITKRSNPWDALVLANDDASRALVNAEQYEYFASHMEDNQSWREKHNKARQTE